MEEKRENAYTFFSLVIADISKFAQISSELTFHEGTRVRTCDFREGCAIVFQHQQESSDVEREVSEVKKKFNDFVVNMLFTRTRNPHRP